jgi:hypothetical protein
MPMSTEIDELFELLEENTGLIRVKGRSYGGIKLKAGCWVGVQVKRKTVEVYFSTNGKKGDLPKEELVQWAEESGLIGSEPLPGVTFELREGVKSKTKISLVAEISYEEESELNSNEVVKNVTSLIILLKDKTASFSGEEEKKVTGIVTPKKTLTDQDTSEDSTTAGDDESTLSTDKQYVFIFELHIEAEDYEECDDDGDNPDFTNPMFELTEALTVRVEEEFTCFAPGNLFKDGKPRLLDTVADLWTHVFYAKQDGLIDAMQAQIAILLSRCDHWDYNFIKASQYAEIEGFTVFGHYPSVGKIGRQGYCGDDLDTGIYLSDSGGEDTDSYTGADAIEYYGIKMSAFDLAPYLKAIAESAED